MFRYLRNLWRKYRHDTSLMKLNDKKNVLMNDLDIKLMKQVNTMTKDERRKLVIETNRQLALLQYDMYQLKKKYKPL